MDAEGTARNISLHGDAGEDGTRWKGGGEGGQGERAQSDRKEGKMRQSYRESDGHALTLETRQPSRHLSQPSRRLVCVCVCELKICTRQREKCPSEQLRTQSQL